MADVEETDEAARSDENFLVREHRREESQDILDACRGEIRKSFQSFGSIFSFFFIS